MGQHRLTMVTKTYLTLPLAKLCRLAKLPTEQHAEDLIGSMVAAGQLFARVDRTLGIVTFDAAPEQFDTPATDRVMARES